MCVCVGVGASVGEGADECMNLRLRGECGQDTYVAIKTNRHRSLLVEPRDESGTVKLPDRLLGVRGRAKLDNTLVVFHIGEKHIGCEG